MTTGIATGTRFGPYEIVGWIGAGGMGEVYRARDTRLGRDVALKLISAAASADPSRVRRFEQEARAAAAIAHPNILAVYDVGVQDGIPYIVSELLEGESLRSRLRGGALPVRRAIDIARHAAEGLAAAHDKDIVHRDVKPDNIFITTDWRVKLLDFGIAKLNASADDPGRTGLPTETNAGAIIGTLGYMSPEQVRGESIDARSDIFSLGVVLYEMVTGTAPFTRQTSADTMAAILGAEPADLAHGVVPPAIARVISRCLEKTRTARYQSARDLAFGLEMLTGTNVTAAAARRRIHWRSLALPSLTIASLAIAAASWILRPSPQVQLDPLGGATFSPLTDWPGNEGGAEISPDGRFVAFLADKAGRFDLWVNQIGSQVFTNLTAGEAPVPAPSAVMRLTGFHADGSQIWKAVDPGAPTTRREYLMPLAGGPARLFLGERDRSPSWSPDGGRIAFFAGTDGDPISVAGPLGADPKEILKDNAGMHNHNPVWSPDGDWIYFVHGRDIALDMDVWRVRPDGSRRERVTHLATDANFVAPLDAHTLLFVARAPDMSGPWLWAADVETGTTRRVSSGLERYTSVAASRDGKRIVVTVAQPSHSLWQIPITDRPATDADVQPYAVDASSPFAPRVSGTSLYFLNGRGPANGLWRVDPGRPPVQVWSGLDGGLIEPAAISRDGKRVAIVLRDGARRRLVSIGPDGTNPRTLGPTLEIRGTPFLGAADWSPDGRWIVAGGDDGSGEGLFMIPADGGAPVRLLTGPAFNPVWSPADGLIIYSGEVVEGRVQLHAVHPDGSAAPFPDLHAGPGAYRFTPDGKRLIFLPIIGAGADNFRVLDLATQKIERVTQMSNKGGLSIFDVTSDGKSLVFERTVQNGDVVLIERSGLPKKN